MVTLEEYVEVPKLALEKLLNEVAEIAGSRQNHSYRIVARNQRIRARQALVEFNKANVKGPPEWVKSFWIS